MFSQMPVGNYFLSHRTHLWYSIYVYAWLCIEKTRWEMIYLWPRTFLTNYSCNAQETIPGPTLDQLAYGAIASSVALCGSLGVAWSLSGPTKTNGKHMTQHRQPWRIFHFTKIVWKSTEYPKRACQCWQHLGTGCMLGFWKIPWNSVSPFPFQSKRVLKRLWTWTKTSGP